MGFRFGLIQSLEPVLAVKCFLAVVAFIIVFEHITGVLEYLLDESPAYSKMLQVIYKELMMMGVISFGITMYEARNSEPSQNIYDTIVAIDFAHIILFYMTIFFVIHAFYLIRISIMNYRKNRHYFASTFCDLAEKVGYITEHPWSLRNLLFRSDFILLSTLRDKVEFKMVENVFRAMYLVPRNFNYPAYISGCYERYALKTINRTILSWVIFLLLIVINYARLFIGYGCTIHDTGGSHRALGSSADTSSSYGGESAHDYTAEDRACRLTTIKTFLVGGAIMVAYNFFLLLVSRVYKLRLVHMTGTDGSHEFKDFLQHVHNFEQADKTAFKVAQRYSTKRLLHEINHEFGTSEHHDEDEEEEELIRHIALSLKTAQKVLTMHLGAVRLQTRAFIFSLFCPERKAQIDKASSTQTIFQQSRSVRKTSRASSSHIDPTSSPTQRTSSRLDHANSDVNQHVDQSLEEGDLSKDDAQKGDAHHIADPVATQTASENRRLTQTLSSTLSLFRRLRSKPRQQHSQHLKHQGSHQHHLLPGDDQTAVEGGGGDGEEFSHRELTVKERLLVTLHRDLPVMSASDLPYDDTDLQDHNHLQHQQQRMRNDASFYQARYDKFYAGAGVQASFYSSASASTPTDITHQKHNQSMHSHNQSILMNVATNPHQPAPHSPQHTQQMHRRALLKKYSSQFQQQQQQHHQGNPSNHVSAYLGDYRRGWQAEALDEVEEVEEEDEVEEEEKQEALDGNDEGAGIEMPSNAARTSSPPSIATAQGGRGGARGGAGTMTRLKSASQMVPTKVRLLSSSSSSIEHKQPATDAAANAHVIAEGSGVGEPSSPAPIQMSPGSLARARSRVLVDVADHEDEDDVSSEAQENEEEDAENGNGKSHTYSNNQLDWDSVHPLHDLAHLEHIDVDYNDDDHLPHTLPLAGSQHQLQQTSSGFHNSMDNISGVGSYGVVNGNTGVHHANAVGNVAGAGMMMCPVRSYRTAKQNSNRTAAITDSHDQNTRQQSEARSLSRNCRDLEADMTAEDAQLQQEKQQLHNQLQCPASTAAASVCQSGQDVVPSSVEEVEAEHRRMFNRIYLFESPTLYFRAIELGIMLSCLYMAIWTTNLLTITKDVLHYAHYEVITQLAMCIPIVVVFVFLPYITETCALLGAVAEIHVGVCKKVLEDTVETAEIVQEVRTEVIECAGEIALLAPDNDQQQLHLLVHRLVHDLHVLDVQIQRLQHKLHAHQVSTQTSQGRRSQHLLCSAEVAQVNHQLAQRTRSRIAKQQALDETKARIDTYALEARRRFIQVLFEELDQDASGYLDRDEFRTLLRKLELTYNEHKFTLLFRAIDGSDGNGRLSQEELQEFLFPSSLSLIDDVDEAMHRLDHSSTLHCPAAGTTATSAKPAKAHK